MIDEARALSFGATAEQYDRARPSYPAALMDDLAALRPRAVLDVGAGTGKASELLLARGLDVVAVEPDARMAAVAERKGIRVEVGRFESWDPTGRSFDLITAGQSWHWVPEAEGAERAMSLLQPGGHLAAFWNLGEFEDTTAEALDAVYDEVAPALARDPAHRHEQPGEEQRRHARSLSGAGFEPVELRTYPWALTYPADQWVEQLATHSDHATLPAAQRDALLRRVAETIDAMGGSFLMSYVTLLILATRP